MGVTSLRTASRDRISADILAGVADLIQGIAVAMITTVDDTGIVRARQVPNINTGLEDHLRFLVSSGSPLVADVRGHPEVLVTLADRGSGRFVVVNGAARVRRDPARVRQLWHPVLASWLPGGPDDPALALIEVQVRGVDVWDYRPGRTTAPAVGRE